MKYDYSKLIQGHLSLDGRYGKAILPFFGWQCSVFEQLRYLYSNNATKTKSPA